MVVNVHTFLLLLPPSKFLFALLSTQVSPVTLLLSSGMMLRMPAVIKVARVEFSLSPARVWIVSKPRDGIMVVKAEEIANILDHYDLSLTVPVYTLLFIQAFTSTGA